MKNLLCLAKLGAAIMKALFIIATALTMMSCAVSKESPTLGYGKEYKELAMNITLRETGETHMYWMYDTYTNFDGDGSSLFILITRWLDEVKGYKILESDCLDINPNPNLSIDIKRAMLKYKRDVSITLVVFETINNALLYINNYDKSKDNWSTEIISLISVDDYDLIKDEYEDL